MKHCIVNFSDAPYKKGQDRLVKSLRDTNYQGDTLLFNDFNQVGCKPHYLVPYQFKVYSMMEAYKRGYDVALYCDASLYAIKNVMPCFNSIIDKGWLLECNGYNNAQYCTDTALQIFGVTRDEAEKIIQPSAGFTGLDFRNPKALEFLNKWYEYAKAETTFIGGWNNNDKLCSKDPRCLGHRHDQSVAAYLIYKLGLEMTTPYFMQYNFPNCVIKESSVFLAQGIS